MEKLDFMTSLGLVICNKEDNKVLNDNISMVISEKLKEQCQSESGK